MSGSSRPDRKGAAELTLKFRKKNEDLVQAFLPKSPWVQLLPQRSPLQRAVLEVDTDAKMIPTLEGLVMRESESPVEMKFPSEKMMETDYRDDKSSEASPTSSNRDKKSSEASPTFSSYSADGFHKLHNLCSSPTSSIEMIRIFTSTYPWALKQRDCAGDLPLHVAIKREDASYMIICELLSKCPETAKTKDKNGDLPLFLACRRPKVNVNVLRTLLQVYPSAAHVKAYGNTALHHLLQKGNASAENVKLLISYNPDAVSTPNNFGNLPLHYLCASERPHILTVRAVLDAYPKGITYVNKSAETPIQRALSKNNDEAMRERIRIMLRASCPSALSCGQLELFRQLNWEARRIIILLCVNLARRSHSMKGVPLYVHADDLQDCKILMDMYHTCDGVWRDIIAFL